MAKRSPGPAAKAAARVNMPSDNSGVKPGPGEARIQEPTVTEWNPMEESQEAPPDDTKPPIDDAGKYAPPANAAEKEARIRKALFGDTEAADGDEAKDDTEQPDDKPAADAKPEPSKPPTRGDMMANLRAEREKRTLENQLKEERAARKAAEERAEAARKLATEGDILSIAKARGLTTDQAIDLLMNPPAEPTKPTAPAKPADDTNERLSRLEQREREVIRREALSVLDEETKELDIPVVRATTRVAVADGSGGTRVMSGRELVLATAQRLWEADGKPEGDRRKYFKEAAPLVEEQLIADDKDRLEAYARKVGGKPSGEAKPAAAKPVAKKPPVPSVGSRSGGGAAEKQEAPPLPDDPDERRQAIKRRLGWGS